MNHQQIVEKILGELQKQIKCSSFREKYFGDNKCFTRERDFPLHELIAFLMQRSGKSLDIKVDEWFSAWKSNKAPVSRQAISKARQLIPEKIFHDFLKLSSVTFNNYCKNKNYGMAINYMR